MSSVAILGNDAVLAARPATAVQLAHACQRAGFDAAVPASWGDELVAAESARQLRARGDGAAILCACPYVETRLLAPGPDLAPLLVPVVAPPVAAARYLRELYAERPVRVTYVGSCPGAAADVHSATPAIDEQLAPAEFLRVLEARGVVLGEQPTVYDSVLPPDRRRYCSLPGGVPTPPSLWASERTPRTLVEIESEDYKAELAQQILAHRRALIDLAPRLGCACSGASSATPHSSARAMVLATEPPRAMGPIVEASSRLELARRIAPPPARPAGSPLPTSEYPAYRGATGEFPVYKGTSEYPVYRGTGEYPAYRGGETPASTPLPPRPKKATPSGIFRAYTGNVPTTRNPDGKPLPRAYAAHRKSPTGNRALGEATGSFPAFGAGKNAPPSSTPEGPAPDAPRSPAPESAALESAGPKSAAPLASSPSSPTVPGPDSSAAGGAAGSVPPRRNAFAFLAFTPPTPAASATGSGVPTPAEEAREGKRDAPPSLPSAPATAPPARSVPPRRPPAGRATPTLAPRPAFPASPRRRPRRTAPLLIGALVLLAGVAATVIADRSSNAARARDARADSASSPTTAESAVASTSIAPVSDSFIDTTAFAALPDVEETADSARAAVVRGTESTAAASRPSGAASGARQRAGGGRATAESGIVAPRGPARRGAPGKVAPSAGRGGRAAPSAPLEPSAPSDGATAASPSSAPPGGPEQLRIRSEIEQRRARIDSILHRLDSLRDPRPRQP